MTDIGPLDGLDAIDWAGLEHAYGPATDVPGLLRELLVADPGRRDKTHWTLYGNIFHQGSRYAASAHAVPFLLALAADAATPGRADVLRLLGALAIGYDESFLPAGVDAAGWRDEVARTRAADPGEV